MPELTQLGTRHFSLLAAYTSDQNMGVCAWLSWGFCGGSCQAVSLRCHGSGGAQTHWGRYLGQSPLQWLFPGLSRPGTPRRQKGERNKPTFNVGKILPKGQVTSMMRKPFVKFPLPFLEHTAGRLCPGEWHDVVLSLMQDCPAPASRTQKSLTGAQRESGDLQIHRPSS